ncbi:MAG TPA: hypothetical protein VEY89_13725, partial [Candidatus Dormibacteraeota bacterium]|nr:hypothetical protein [Candidatus Dormibacteraeota bacterium]
MNASVESLAPSARAPAAPRDIGSAAAVREGILQIPDGLSLHHGARLSSVRIAWRLVGAAPAPVVCALGGISAHRQVCDSE